MRFRIVLKCTKLYDITTHLTRRITKIDYILVNNYRLEQVNKLIYVDTLT